MNYRCELCNEEYDLPEFNSDIIQNIKKCRENSKICSWKSNEPICKECYNGYI